MNPIEFVNICTVYPKKEPLRLVFCRGCVAIILMLVMIGYLCLQAIAVAQLKTTISPSVETASFIPFPDITFMSQMEFEIDCDYQTSLNDFLTRNTSCSEFLTDIERLTSETSSVYHRINFTTGLNSDITFSSHDLTKIGFNITITDPTFVSNATNETRINFNLFFVDSEFDPYKITPQQAGETDPNFLQNILQTNYYELHPHLVHECDLTRMQVDSKIKHWWDFTGAPLEHISEKQMLSTMNTRPFDASIQPSLSSRFVVHMKNFHFTHDKEEMQITFLDLLGTVGGVVGITTGIYLWMFGDTQVDPLGVIQKSPVIQQSLKEKQLQRFSGIMLSADIYAELPLEERVKRLYLRMVALERYLEEYVIDTDFLDDVQVLEKIQALEEGQVLEKEE